MEEFQSTNEELQSTNEELTTSKEELQSLNEELQTVNAELQAKVDESFQCRTATGEPAQQHGHRYALPGQRAQRAAVHHPGDEDHQTHPRRRGPAHHRPCLGSALPGNGRGRAEGAAERWCSAEKPIAARDGRWFTVRIMPYRTLDDRIDGVVITFRGHYRGQDAGGEVAGEARPVWKARRGTIREAAKQERQRTARTKRLKGVATLITRHTSFSP